jgi:hypothetical protein
MTRPYILGYSYAYAPDWPNYIAVDAISLREHLARTGALTPVHIKSYTIDKHSNVSRMHPHIGYVRKWVTGIQYAADKDTSYRYVAPVSLSL